MSERHQTRLIEAFNATSPRVAARPVPAASTLLFFGVIGLWIFVFLGGFVFSGLLAWSAGLLYVFYDTALLLNVTRRTWFVHQQPMRAPTVPPVTGPRPTLGVIVAARNEQNVLAGTINALFAQTDPPDEIIIADDGSIDRSAEVLANVFGVTPPPLGEISAPVAAYPGLRLLRLPHGGKARALNQAIERATTDIFLTVDADTILEPEALAAMRRAFAEDPQLVAACGVLTPVCSGSWTAGFFQWFQTYEYVRAFVSRVAWARAGALLLVSGAFAGFRRAAVLTVGGFDPDCLVEDYELIHRLRRYGYQHGLNWHSMALGSARATTAAPDRPLRFLRQRRRWFGGFLQTQFWYREMVGNRQYHRLGTWMLPVKAADTLQPIYGLFAFALLLFYIVTGKAAVLIPVGGFIIGKIILDLAFHAWSIRLYRNWTGGHTKVSFGFALLAAIVEPFSFQLLRHLGASWGWLRFITGKRGWS